MKKIKHLKWKKNVIGLAVGSMVLVMAVSIFVWIFFNYSIRKSGLEGSSDIQYYDKHYVMIVDNPDSLFWRSVYESGVKEANEQGAILELKGVTSSSGYKKTDLMRMCIAESVDGILIQYSGEFGLETLIDKAVQHNIVVATISEDDPQSKRQSFVGVNTYQLGEAYSEQVLSLMNKNTKKIMILTNSFISSTTQKLVSVQIRNAVAKSPLGSKIDFEVKNVSAVSSFDSEEAIRNIFLTSEGPPDILVCLDETDTECAYQAVIDYNEVGQVSIVGYYTTPTILEGIQKGIIAMTVELDAQQMGKSAVDALVEYGKEGRVSEYFSVDVNIITSHNVEDYLKQNEE